MPGSSWQHDRATPSAQKMYHLARLTGLPERQGWRRLRHSVEAMTKCASNLISFFGIYACFSQYTANCGGHQIAPARCWPSPVGRYEPKLCQAVYSATFSRRRFHSSSVSP